MWLLTVFKTEWKTNPRMRNLNLLPTLKFYCTTKMEVVEEINSSSDDRLDFLETFEEHREELLHVLKNTYVITAAVLGEDYLRWIVETYFGLRDNIISMVDRMDVLEANLWELHRSQKFWNASLTPTKCKRLFLRAITNEKGLINKFFKIYSFKFYFRWNVRYYSVCNKSIANKRPFVLLRKLSAKTPTPAPSIADKTRE